MELNSSRISSTSSALSCLAIMNGARLPPPLSCGGKNNVILSTLCFHRNVVRSLTAGGRDQMVRATWPRYKLSLWLPFEKISYLLGVSFPLV